MNNSEVRQFSPRSFSFFPKTISRFRGICRIWNSWSRKRLSEKRNAECADIRDGTFVVPQKQERKVIHCCSAIGNRKNSTFLLAGFVCALF
ncbi:hypothetical protein CDAR_118941 [Caerostris darwini]|uniref:Uncharacterized protein n=1 Tax=Caerostris darwini TaxID=1538125 RepID=A0AAV4VBF7_9ARAC|nr:hypothetical protein CDAR_118941 [Caerostris darwini]